MSISISLFKSFYLFYIKEFIFFFYFTQSLRKNIHINLPIIYFYRIYIIGIVLLLLVFSFNISLYPLTSKSKYTLTFRSNLSLTVSPLTPLLSKPTIYFFSLRCRHHFFFFFAQITSPLTVRLPLPLFKSQAATSIHLHK